YRIEDYQSALEDFNKAIELDNNYAIAYLNRGNTKEMLRDMSGACEDWKKAADLGISSAEMYHKQLCNK
ncbi:MAG TPA: tetratricopeptide repeat protein, partial [Bacteroidales bacterium]|nr:tetratricopeptide repeat protein [Bacteroidales bacterium]